MTWVLTQNLSLKKEMIEISTDRLVLKKTRKSDKDKELLVSRIGDWEVAKWLCNVPHPYTEDDAEAWFKTLHQKEFSLNVYLDNSLIGGIGLAQDEDKLYEFGYWLGRDYWGQGYATEAGKGLLHYATQKLSSPKIKANYMKGNVASANVLKKLGFNKVGEGKTYCVSRKEEVDCIHVALLKPIGLNKDNVIEAADRFNKKEEIWVPN